MPRAGSYTNRKYKYDMLNDADPSPKKPKVSKRKMTKAQFAAWKKKREAERAAARRKRKSGKDTSYTME